MPTAKLPNGQAERRVFPGAELRMMPMEGQHPKIVGHPAVFNKKAVIRSMWGDFAERIAPGAFADVLPTADVRMLFNHDPNFVLGRSKSGTMTLQEDSTGLYVECTPPDTQLVNDMVMTPMQRGDITQMSFMFIVGDSRWDVEDGMDVRTILKFSELFDTSVVTFPAYEDTDAAVRSYEEYRKTKGGVYAPEGNWEGQLDVLARQLELHR